MTDAEKLDAIAAIFERYNDEELSAYNAMAAIERVTHDE